MFILWRGSRRRASALGVLTGLALLVGCGSGDSSPAAATSPPSAGSTSPIAATTTVPKLHVDIIGDSITAESKAKLQLDEYELYIWAQFGITIEEQLSPIDKSIARSPHVLVIQLGGNDMGHWGPAIVAEVTGVLDAAAVLDCVRWVNLSGSSPNVVEFNALLADEAGTRDNFEVIDWAQATIDNPTWLSSDGTHPSDPDGMVGFADLVAESVRSCPL